MPSIIDKLNDEQSGQVEQLAKALLSLEGVDQACAFLEDIASVSEIKAMGQRLEVARLLRENMTYPQIVQMTGASTATISRVRKALDYGAGGYAAALDRIYK